MSNAADTVHLTPIHEEEDDDAFFADFADMGDDTTDMTQEDTDFLSQMEKIEDEKKSYAHEMWNSYGVYIITLTMILLVLVIVVRRRIINVEHDVNPYQVPLQYYQPLQPVSAFT